MNILARYGIKEVADVTFYDINEDGTPRVPVLYLDTLKVTTIEQTAEETEARGGKGNAALIAWDYGKEINVTIEDALFSAKSMAIMFGNGSVAPYTGDQAFIMKTEQFIASASAALPEQGDASGETSSTAGWNPYFNGPDGKHKYIKLNPKFFTANNEKATALVEGEPYFCSYDILVDGAVIEVSANSFPGTYYVTGDTYARSEATGDDEFFQFIIPKAKIQSENTITLEAEGDPSVFNMNLKVLRPADGVMMKLVKYNLVDSDLETTGIESEIYHNHYLDTKNVPSSDDDSEEIPATVSVNMKVGDAETGTYTYSAPAGYSHTFGSLTGSAVTQEGNVFTAAEAGSASIVATLTKQGEENKTQTITFTVTAGE